MTTKVKKRSKAKEKPAPAVETPPAAATQEDFPAELAGVKYTGRVTMPPVEKPGEAFSGNEPIRDEALGAARDEKAAAAVKTGSYVPGVHPPLDGDQIHFEAPDGVIFAGPKDDYFTDPRNGRQIRPLRKASPQHL